MGTRKNWNLNIPAKVENEDHIKASKKKMKIKSKLIMREIRDIPSSRLRFSSHLSARVVVVLWTISFRGKKNQVMRKTKAVVTRI